MSDLQETANKLYAGKSLAPMVRASTTPLRALALHYGADFVYSEELVDRSISETTRVVNEELGTIDYVKHNARMSKKAKKRLKNNVKPALILRIDPKLETGKFVCQLGSGEPELALAAAKHVHKDVSSIDINMGCPKKFSVSGGMGSALLSDPDRGCRILKSLRAELPLPISCKIRLLKDTKSTVEYVDAMVNAGANAVAIHSRRVGDESTSPADWNALEEVFSIIRPKHPTIPLLINGDFYDRSETEDMISKTGANGVLLARPALYNTSIFRPLTERLEDKTVVVQRYVEQSVRYDMNHKNTKYVICEMMSNRRNPNNRTSQLPQSWPGGHTVAKTCDCHSLQAMCELWNVNWIAPTTTATIATPANGESTSIGINGNDNDNDMRHHGNKAAAGTTATENMAAGEHKYDDSYLIERLGDTSTPTKSQSQPKKKAKVRESLNGTMESNNETT